MDIQIEDGTKIISHSPFHISDRLKEGVKAEIDTLLSNDIIEESDNPWCSPFVPVMKPDGQV